MVLSKSENADVRNTLALAVKVAAVTGGARLNRSRSISWPCPSRRKFTAQYLFSTTILVCLTCYLGSHYMPLNQLRCYDHGQSICTKNRHQVQKLQTRRCRRRRYQKIIQ
jgi:hypothetical protein